MKSQLVLVGVLSVMCRLAQAQDWGCYDPKPGHPTSAEREAFVREVSQYALAAERAYGVPAPAMVAMAIQESAYGFTRLGLDANNLFGFKWGPAEEGRNRQSWELTCQPAWDIGRLYVHFRSRDDAVDHVARRLAKSKSYRRYTEAFISAMARGDDRARAVQAWIEGIADLYNYDPPAYTKTLKRLLNNAVAPSDTLSPTHNLYRLVATPPRLRGALPSQ